MCGKKRGGGHKAQTSVKESVLSGSARQLTSRQAKQGPGSPPATPECQGKVSALALAPAPGVGSREGSEQYQGSTPSLQTAKNRSERAEKTKGEGSGEDPTNKFNSSVPFQRLEIACHGSGVGHYLHL